MCGPDCGFFEIWKFPIILHGSTPSQTQRDEIERCLSRNAFVLPSGDFLELSIIYIANMKPGCSVYCQFPEGCTSTEAVLDSMEEFKYEIMKQNKNSQHECCKNCYTNPCLGTEECPLVKIEMDK